MYVLLEVCSIIGGMYAGMYWRECRDPTYICVYVHIYLSIFISVYIHTCMYGACMHVLEGEECYHKPMRAASVCGHIHSVLDTYIVSVLILIYRCSHTTTYVYWREWRYQKVPRATSV